MQEVNNILIIGARESGVGAALLSVKLGHYTFVSDAGSIPIHFRSELENAGISFEENGHKRALQGQFHLVIVSPGVPDDAAVLQHFIKLQIPVISEIEFAWRHIGESCLIGITGSNGKTTVTSLIHHCLKTNNYNAALVGNVGFSFARTVAGSNHDFYVCELSSFQLDKIETLKPHISIITNITPDHLDRYEYKFENYIASKLRITINQDMHDLLVIRQQDMVVKANLSTAARVLEIPDAYTVDYSYYSTSGHYYAFQNTALRGRHNWMNMAQTVEVLEYVGLNPEQISSGLNTFIPIPHRMQIVSRINDVLFINDSKATNVDSAKFALDAVSAPVIWIAGGTDKGNNYDELIPLVKEKVKWLVCLGIDNTSLITSFKNAIPGFSEVRSMNSAIETALQKSTAGDTVLLSPACASFDLFNNYEDRGNQFIEAIKRLEESQKREASTDLFDINRSEN